MKNNITIKQSIKQKMLTYLLMPMALILTVICVILSFFRWNQYCCEVDNGAINNAQYINMQLTYLEHTANNIISDGVIEKIFNGKSDISFSESIEVLDELNKYCKRFYNSYNAENMNIKIYHNNHNIHKSEYSRYLDELGEEISEKLADTEEMTNMWFSDDKTLAFVCNIGDKENTVILVCGIDNITLNGFLNINMYYSNLGLTSNDIFIASSEEVEEGNFKIVQPLLSGQSLVVKIPVNKKAELFMPIIIMCCAMFVFMLALSLVLVNNISARMTKKIYDFFELIKSERLYEDIECAKIDENDELYAVFDKIKQLVHEIKNADKEKDKLQAENMRLQLAHAQAQINPHLLYNSLSCMRWKCIDDNPELTEQIDAMTDYYRASVTDVNTRHTIADEIDLIKKYIKLISMMRATDYKYTVDVDNSLMNIETVQHVFQPFVENAVLHGINRNADGMIKIIGHRDGDNAVFVISDNGVGFDVSETKLKISNLRYEKKYMGLRNTISRIKLYYGEKSSVDVISTEGKGTDVIIKFLIKDIDNFK